MPRCDNVYHSFGHAYFFHTEYDTTHLFTNLHVMKSQLKDRSFSVVVAPQVTLCPSLCFSLLSVNDTAHLIGWLRRANFVATS
jgi:hypothetical protein